MPTRARPIEYIIGHGQKAELTEKIHSSEHDMMAVDNDPQSPIVIRVAGLIQDLEMDLQTGIVEYRGRFTAALGKACTVLTQEVMLIPSEAMPQLRNGIDAIALPAAMGKLQLNRDLSPQEVETTETIRLASEAAVLLRFFAKESTSTDTKIKELLVRIEKVVSHLMEAQHRLEAARKNDTSTQTVRELENDEAVSSQRHDILQGQRTMAVARKDELAIDCTFLKQVLNEGNAAEITALLHSLFEKYGVDKPAFSFDRLAVGVNFKERKPTPPPREMWAHRPGGFSKFMRTYLWAHIGLTIAFIYLNYKKEELEHEKQLAEVRLGSMADLNASLRTLEDAIGYTPSSTIQYHPVDAFIPKSTKDLEASQPPNISPETAESNRRSFQAVHQLAHVREQLHKAVIYEGNTEDVRDLLRFVDRNGAITFTTRVDEKEVVTITGSRGRQLDTEPEHFTVNYNTDVNAARLDFDTCTIQSPVDFKTQQWMRISFLSAVQQMRSEIQPHVPYEKNHMFFLRELQSMDPASYTQLTLEGPKILQEIFDGQLPAWAIHEFVLKLYDLEKYEGHADERTGVSMGTGAIMYHYAAAHGKTVDEVEEKFHQIVSLGRFYKQGNK